MQPTPRNKLYMTREDFPSYNDEIARVYRQLHPKEEDKEDDMLCKDVTVCVTEACNLACTYCYECHKTSRRMSWETAKRIVDGLIELPFALPTAVAGITLSKLYSETGFFGKMLAGIGIKVTYTKTGLVIALVFVGLPFVIRAVQPVLEKLDGQYEEAAYMLGASPVKTFFLVILPELRPAILTGFGLALARGIGEYGSVIYISGNSAKEKTQVVSYVIMQKLSYIDYESATAIALVMLVLSFVLLLFVNIVQARQAARTNLL